MAGETQTQQQSLVRKFSIYLAVMLVIISAITYGISYQVSLKNAHEELKQKTTQHINELQKIITTPLWNFDNHEIHIIGDTFLANEFVDALEITNSNHEVIYRNDKREKQPLFTLERTIMHNDMVIGHILYTASQNSLDKLKRHFLFSYVINIFAIVLGTLLVVGFFFRSAISTTFKQFGEHVLKFAHGNETRVEIPRAYKEFTPLIDALNKLATDRSNAEAATQEAVYLRENILAASPIGIAVFDHDGQCISANEALCKIIGAPGIQAVIESNIHQIKSWKQSGLYDAALRARNTRQAQHIESQIVTRFAKALSIECLFFPVTTENREYLLLMASDITQRKANEQELDSYRHELEEQVEKRTEELRDTQYQMIRRERLASIGQLTGGIAHDFNNILAVIAGFNELTLSLAEENNDNNYLEYSKEISSAVSRAITLVSQLLTFSRGVETERSVLMLEPIVNETLRLLKPTLPSSIEFKTHLENKLPPILANSTHIHQMIMNLCINARDAVGGKGKITVSTSTVELNSHTCSSCHHGFSGHFVELSVADNGHGISPGDLEYIFDPFFTTKEIGKGTGMGLSVIHGIMHNYSGHILVDSTETETRFRLLFPVYEQVEEAAPEEEVKQTVQDEQSINILLVDDEVSIVTYLVEILTRHGYNVTSQTSSTDALSLFISQPEKYDLLITDLTMPELTGLDLARIIYQDHPDMPVILCSGYNSATYSLKDSEYGIKAVLKKPLETKELLSCIYTVTRDNSSKFSN